MEKVQEQFDALVKAHGAAAVIEAIKGHVHPDGPGNCQTTGCAEHYICNPTTGNCQLDIGG